MNAGQPKKASRPTLKEIAQLAGVSVSTVSFVLSGRGVERRISAEVEARIREIARQKGYPASLIARRHTPVRSLAFYNAYKRREIGDLYMDRLTAAIEYAAGMVGYAVLVHCDFRLSEEDLFDALTGGLAAGVLFFGRHENDPLLRLLRTSTLPTVLIGHQDDEGFFSSIAEDMPDAMQKVADALVRLGHRRFAAISGQRWPDSFPRIAALRGHLERHGIALPDASVFHLENITYRSKAVSYLMSLPEPPTALFCPTDWVGYKMLEALETAGVAVPERLSVIGYDGIHWPSSSPHVLASMEVPIASIALDAVRLLDEQSSGVVSSTPVVRIVPIKLNPGTTLAPPPRE
jgi:LacI family transcriptional regulator